MPKGIPNKRYTCEFKQMVVETMMREKLSYIETRKRFDIAGEDRVRSWERIYLTEGAEGLYIERRGRASTGRPRKLPKKTEEDLLAEVQRLRAENTYLMELEANGKIVNENPATYYAGDSISLVNLSVPGFIFEGWYDGEGSNAEQIKVIENKTSTAHVFGVVG